MRRATKELSPDLLRSPDTVAQDCLTTVLEENTVVSGLTEMELVQQVDFDTK